MRKSNNYFKFLEYVTYGKDHDDAIDKGNGVMECKSYVSISDIEDRYKTTFGLENQWLTFKNILINEDTLYVYYLEDENSKLVAVYLLDNFKTQKELKDAITTACVEFLHDLLLEKSEVRDDKEKQYFDTDSLQPNKTISAKIENINHCPNQSTCCIVSSVVHCNYNYKSDSCIKAHKNFIHHCEQVHKQMKAKNNSEWHHVRLAKLANIDIDMLDEKRQRYFKIYKELIKTVNDLHKCKTAATYENRWLRFKQVIADDINFRGTTLYMTRFLDSKISMCNVECGLWSSADEKATSFIKSRRYRHTTLK